MAASLVALSPDADHSSVPGFGSAWEGVLDDPFAYEGEDPTANLPDQVFGGVNGFHGNEADGVEVTLGFTFEPVTLAEGASLVIDLYGRDSNECCELRDDDFDVVLYSGETVVETFANLAIENANPNHLRVRYEGNESVDGLRLIARDTENPAGSYFTLMEIRAAVLDPIVDQDGDGLPDSWELTHGLDETSAEGRHGAAGDPDEDALSNLGEYEAKTDPQDPDSDDDTLLDGAEIAGADARPATHPLLVDTDADGLSDAVETNTGVFVSATDTGSNPTLTDTDSDGTHDGVEVQNESDPNDASVGSNLVLGKMSQFYDADGNPVEPWPGFPPGNIIDGDIETLSHPNDQASGDYYYEVDLGGEFVITGMELTGRANCCQERLEDATLSIRNLVGSEVYSQVLTGQIIETQTIDLSEASPKGQFIRIINTSGSDYGPQINEMAVFGMAGTTDDQDGDGLPDVWEVANNLDANSAAGMNGADGDPDDDGLSNIGEFNARTDPQDPDSDGDGLLDGAEIAGADGRPATDPLSADTDEDTLSDGAETNTGVFVSATDTGSNPTLADTDGDGTSDGTELERRTNPNDPESGANLAAGMVGQFYNADGDPVEPWAGFSTAHITDSDLTTIAHPLDEAAAHYYFEIDLGEEATITQLEITGRGFRDACCADRLENVTISIIDSLGEEVYSEVVAEQIVMTELIDLSVAQPRGQFVRIINTLEAPYGPQLGELAVFGSFTPIAPIMITSMARDAAGMVNLEWTSEPGQFFELRSSATMLPGEWTRILKETPAAAEGAITAALVETAGAPETYFQVKRVPPPATFSDDFEGGDEGWTVVSNGIESETTWERGTPTAVGPAEANSGVNVYGTDLDAAYAETLLGENNAGIALRTPVIDLAGDTSVKLSFSYYLDLAADEQGGGRINLRDEDGVLIETLSTLLIVDDAIPMQAWTLFGPETLSPAVVEKGKIIVEFEFLSIDSAGVNGGGLYIDDVIVN